MEDERGAGSASGRRMLPAAAAVVVLDMVLSAAMPASEGSSWAAVGAAVAFVGIVGWTRDAGRGRTTRAGRWAERARRLVAGMAGGVLCMLVAGAGAGLGFAVSQLGGTPRAVVDARAYDGAPACGEGRAPADCVDTRRGFVLSLGPREDGGDRRIDVSLSGGGSISGVVSGEGESARRTVCCADVSELVPSGAPVTVSIYRGVLEQVGVPEATLQTTANPDLNRSIHLWVGIAGTLFGSLAVVLLGFATQRMLLRSRGVRPEWDPQRTRWVGGMRLPWGLNATWPLATLTITDRGVVIRALGMRVRDYRWEDIGRVERVRGFAVSPGVRIMRRDALGTRWERRGSIVFWTFASGAVLAALERRGAPIVERKRPARVWMST